MDVRSRLEAACAVASTRTAVRARARRASTTDAAKPPVFGHDLRTVVLCTIGSSTGGPAAVQALLEAARADLHFPIVIAQHMPAGFTKLFAERLNALSKLKVSELVHGESLKAGCAYIVPGERHARIEPGLCAALFEGKSEGTHMPSVDVLFSSAAAVCGRGVLGVLLTGIGRDGARGLLEIREAEGWTIGQDASTSIVYGMPRAAKELGAVIDELSLPRICDLLPRTPALTRKRKLAAFAATFNRTRRARDSANGHTIPSELDVERAARDAQT